ncbi:ATP-binding domain-containing protein [Rhizobium pisi]|uniref:ATP-binding domain-containing protein n=1 Tax=Rhizobium pisi TaxID=574561 RepID=UPI0039B1268F
MRYRRFRRLRQLEGEWYTPRPIAVTELGGLELDVVLLCTLREAAALSSDRRILRDIDRPVFAPLKSYLDLTRNQVMVDEATDFSPLQLACMYALCTPGVKSFFACGDFNQRVTNWGSRSDADLEWAVPRISIRPIAISYRHSKQLSDLAAKLIALAGGKERPVQLPSDVNSDGVAPALALGLGDPEAETAWLADRILEVERYTSELPSVAVLVRREEDVIPLAARLKEKLEPFNVNVVPCTNGQVVGQENDVRVFDVQHIKGLEFEAVFFVGIDELALTSPDLFDKYLYVGATRAATFLGLTCNGPALPPSIRDIEGDFTDGWHG